MAENNKNRVEDVVLQMEELEKVNGGEGKDPRLPIVPIKKEDGNSGGNS